MNFFDTGNLDKNLYDLIWKYILDRLRPTRSKIYSLSLNVFNNSPCFPTMFMIFLFAPFKRSSYFFTKDIPSFSSFAFLPSRSSVNHFVPQKLLVLMQSTHF